MSLDKSIARLRTIIAIQEARVRSDPIPHLKQAMNELMRARKCFEEIQYALSPDLVFDIATECNVRPTDINGEALLRCNAAKKVISNYLAGA